MNSQALSARSVRAIWRRTTTGTRPQTRWTRPRPSSRWNANSSCTGSIRGSGTATPIRVSREEASSSMTRTRMWFYEESRKRGMKLISVHKGYSYQSRTLGHLANPKDVEKAALQNPDFNFVVYHSALKHGPNEANWKESNKYDPTTGDFEWHKILMDIKQRNPKMNNVYCEIGSFFGVLAVADPVMAMHGMGKNIKHYGADHVVWGTDCLWWGSPQWVIDAFKRFQISDEMCEKFGYKKISKEDKAKIFGLNAAKLYKVKVKDKRNPFPPDALDRLKTAYIDGGGQRSNIAYGWVRADD